MNNHRMRRWICVSLALTLAMASGVTVAQEFSPRAYWPAPVGTKLFITGYAHQSGDVLLDPTLPVFGVDSRINTVVLGYLQTIELFGRNANLLFEAPYSWGTTRGILNDIEARADFAGFNDVSATLSVNLVGAPGLTVEDFLALRAEPRSILGFSLKVVPPTGYYESDRLINVGANRWAGRLQFGAIFPLHRKWLLELDAGAWLFGDNTNYLGGRREQDPIYAFEAHLVHRIRPGLWASLDANWYTGGRQTVDGETRDDRQQNARIGGTLVFPFYERHAIKLGYSVGLRTRSGADSEQLLMTYQYLIP